MREGEYVHTLPLFLCIKNPLIVIQKNEHVKEGSESTISGCILHWDDVSLGTGKLWAFLFVKFPARRGFLVCELFLLAEFFLCVSTPACGDFLLTELFLSVGFPCLWSSPAQVFCLGSFTDCVVPPILALYTSYGSAVTFRISRYLQPLSLARVWCPPHDKVRDSSTVEEKWLPPSSLNPGQQKRRGIPFGTPLRGIVSQNLR